MCHKNLKYIIIFRTVGVHKTYVGELDISVSSVRFLFAKQNWFSSKRQFVVKYMLRLLPIEDERLEDEGFPGLS